MDTSGKSHKDVPLLAEKKAFTATDEPVDAAMTSAGANRKILIVDDNPFVLKAFQMKLKGCGFNVLTATDPGDGIKAARSERPVAVVLDLNFQQGRVFSSTNWSGMHVLQWLKQYKDVAGIPVVILTGDEAGESKDQALAAGAAAYFQKPVDLKTFLAELLRLIGEKPQS